MKFIKYLFSLVRWLAVMVSHLFLTQKVQPTVRASDVQSLPLLYS